MKSCLPVQQHIGNNPPDSDHICKVHEQDISLNIRRSCRCFCTLLGYLKTYQINIKDNNNSNNNNNNNNNNNSSSSSSSSSREVK